MQPAAHCLPVEAAACVVGPVGSGLGLAPTSVGQYGDYVTVSSHQAVPDPLHYSTAHPAATDFASAMYVNTVWGAAPDQTSAHPGQHPATGVPPPGVYYDSYPPYAAAGYPMLSGQDGGLPHGYPGMPGGGGCLEEMEDDHLTSHCGKRKRRRVITYEQRKAANVRERKRMCHLNDAFDVLRKRVPTFAYEKKLSRIETLKLAVTYIQYMAELLGDLDPEADSPNSKKSKRSSMEGEQGAATPATTAASTPGDCGVGDVGKENSPLTLLGMQAPMSEEDGHSHMESQEETQTLTHHSDDILLPSQQQQHQVSPHGSPGVMVCDVTGSSPRVEMLGAPCDSDQ